MAPSDTPHPSDGAPLSAARRAALLALAFGLWFLASPGVLAGDGLPVLGPAFLALWALAAARPGPRAGWVEWAVGGIGLVAPTFWMAYVFPPSPAIAALGLGVYTAAAGLLLRRLLRRGWPLWLAAALAWLALETLRDVLEPPLGFGWLRLGHLLGAWPWLLGSARWFGVEGGSFGLAALGGGLAQAWLRWRALEPAPRRPAWPLAALAPAGLLALAAALSRPPELAPGPALLLVQPDVDVWDKHDQRTGSDRLREHLELTRAGLAAAESQGLSIDLVVWPETNLPFAVAAPGLDEAIAGGARFPAWRGPEWSPRKLADLGRIERAALDNWIWPALGAVPAFLCGVERWNAAQGLLRRENAASLWQQAGDALRQDSLKLALAPGGETVFGLERWGWLRARIEAAAGYLPDLLPGEHSQVLEFVDRSGTRRSVLATVCFDNAHQYPYLEGLARRDAEFIAVLSNEAWYHGQLELDQMLAFSRALAVITGRPLVRATNDGLTLALGPDGRELARLTVDGQDRGVAGCLSLRLPVPASGIPRPPYGPLAPWLRGLCLALPLALALPRAAGLSRRERNRTPRGG